MKKLQSGKTKTTTIGYINRNNQEVLGTRGIKGNDHKQYAYKMKCLKYECGEIYGANGSDIFQRKCPRCQGGASGIPY